MPSRSGRLNHQHPNVQRLFASFTYDKNVAAVYFSINLIPNTAEKSQQIPVSRQAEACEKARRTKGTLNNFQCTYKCTSTEGPYRKRQAKFLPRTLSGLGSRFLHQDIRCHPRRLAHVAKKNRPRVHPSKPRSYVAGEV